MTATKEIEIVLLYTLYRCGKRVTSQKATAVTEEYLQQRPGDEEFVSGYQSRIENRIAFTRQTLKDKGQLSMPYIGTWEITQAGIDRLKENAKYAYLTRIHGKKPTEWERFTPRFLDDLITLGQKVCAEYIESLSEEDRLKLVELGVKFEVEKLLETISFSEKTETPR